MDKFITFYYFLLLCILNQSKVKALRLGSLTRSIAPGVEEIKLAYYPTTSDRRDICLDDIRSLTQSGLKEGAPTAILIDGFLTNSTSIMLRTLKDSFLSRGDDTNVIVLDWESISGFQPDTPNENSIVSTLAFFPVVRNIGDVGSKFADLVNFLSVQKGISYSDFHLIGMSLGAHIAGKAGRVVKEKYGGEIGRITGLDPATTILPSRITRLRKGAASFVDMYHTNRGVLGEKPEGTGDMNIYINGGASQPGCEQKDFSGLGLPGLCSHTFAWRFFDATFRRDFLACPCSGRDCLCKLNCSSSCSNPVRTGISTPLSCRGTYHLTTEELKDL